MFFDVSQNPYKKGDKLILGVSGKTFEVKVVRSSVADFERSYLLQHKDGSTEWMPLNVLKASLLN